MQILYFRMQVFINGFGNYNFKIFLGIKMIKIPIFVKIKTGQLIIRYFKYLLKTIFNIYDFDINILLQLCFQQM